MSCSASSANPFEVVYEDLITEDGYRRAILGVLEHLGLDTGTSRPLRILARTGSQTAGSTRPGLRYTSERPASPGAR